MDEINKKPVLDIDINGDEKENLDEILDTIDPYGEHAPLPDDALFATADDAINRVKCGDEFSLTEKDPTIRTIQVGVGWDLKAFDTHPLDLDASIFLLDKNNLTRVDEDFVFYNCAIGGDGAVKHHGDNRTGAGDGDDEIITIELNTLPYEITRLAFVLSIYDVDFQEHNFSMVKNVFFRVSNKETNSELFRFELDDELSAGNEGLMIGFIERVGNEWIFQAVGDTVKGGLYTIAKEYGIVIAEDAQA